MPFRFNCEKCDVRIKVPDGSEGKKVKCPSCGQAQRVPGGAGVAAPVAAAAQLARTEVRQPVAATSATPPKAPAKQATADTAKSRPSVAARITREASRLEPVNPQAREHDAHDALAALAAAEAPEPLPAPVQPAQAKLVDAVNPPAATAPEPTTASATPETERDSGSTVDAGQSAAQEQEALHAFLAATEPHIEVTDPTTTEASSSILFQITPMPEPSNGSHVDVPVDEAPELQVNSTSQDSAPDAKHEVSESIATETSSSEPMQMSISMDALFGAPSTSTSIQSQNAPAELAPSSAPSAMDETVDDETVGRSISASEVGEAPAGEVRDLFDDFVRRESIQREAENNAKSSHEVAAMEPAPSVKTATRAAAGRTATPVEPVIEPTPVVVAKTPIRVTRGGAVTAKATPPAVKDPPAESMTAEDETDALAAALAPRRAPQAIPLSAPPPMPALTLTASMDPLADIDPHSTPPAAQAALVPPVAKSRRVAPAPAYSLLIVLCWALRVLACLSLVSVVKLSLMALDAGHKTLDVLIIAPLGLGVAAAIWAVGEVARVARDSARNNHR